MSRSQVLGSPGKLEHRLLERALRLGGAARRHLDLGAREERGGRQRIRVGGVAGRGQRLVVACPPRPAGRLGPRPARRPRAATRPCREHGGHHHRRRGQGVRPPARRGCGVSGGDRGGERSTAGHVAGGDERHRRRPRHEPGPVDGRLEPERDRHERERDQRCPVAGPSRAAVGARRAAAARISPVVRAAAASQAINRASAAAAPSRPRSASVWTPKPWAWRVTAASVRWRSRATSKAPAPTPSSGRSSNTRRASRQYFPRVDDVAVKRLAPPSVTRRSRSPARRPGLRSCRSARDR